MSFLELKINVFANLWFNAVFTLKPSDKIVVILKDCILLYNSRVAFIETFLFAIDDLRKSLIWLRLR